MPSVVINLSRNVKPNNLEEILPELRSFIAEKLSCDERTLAPEEVSIQVFTPVAQLPISDIEVIISVHSYPARVEKQDSICLDIKNFIISKDENFNSTFVWLQLSELGHSVEE